MVMVAHVSDKSGRRSLLVWPLLLVAGLSMFSSFAFPEHGFKLDYCLLIVTAVGIYAPYGPYWANVSETIPEEMLGKAIGLINGSGAAGGILGVWLVGILQAETGNLDYSFLLMSISLIVSTGLMLFVRSSQGETG
jgi:MFS family permease